LKAVKQKIKFSTFLIKSRSTGRPLVSSTTGLVIGSASYSLRQTPSPTQTPGKNPDSGGLRHVITDGCCLQRSNFRFSQYNLGLVFHTIYSGIFYPLLFTPAFSTPAFSTLAILPVSHFLLPHFQSPRSANRISWGR